ncbi:unnamed protein product [Trichogramma brassicae]|uniref:Uncharacterized protein n=1 Tax=Trichogramma brassicae TaxID=86971 RepID=A0A6H5IL61_9HYME|nr:unnamed protein product [Trichogramma brassicae]
MSCSLYRKLRCRRTCSWNPEVPYLLKIGLDGKVKQYLKPDMRCRIVKEAGFNKIFEDDRGNYCVSSACVRNIESDLDRDFDESGYVKLRSKCFQPEDFKDISTYIITSKKIFISHK